MQVSPEWAEASDAGGAPERPGPLRGLAATDAERAEGEEAMNTWDQLWCMVLVAPNGLPQQFKIRAPSEAVLYDKVAQYKPDWTVALDEYGNPLIRREPTT